MLHRFQKPVFHPLFNAKTAHLSTLESILKTLLTIKATSVETEGQNQEENMSIVFQMGHFG